MSLSLSDCESCWETPCVCNDGKGYDHLSTVELKCIMRAIDNLIRKKEFRMDDPEKRYPLVKPLTIKDGKWDY